MPPPYALGKSFLLVLEFCHKDGEEVPGAQMAGLKKAPAWFLRKKERPVVFLGGLEG